MGSSRMNVRDFSEWDESDVRVRPNKKGSRPRTKDRPTFKEAIHYGGPRPLVGRRR